ncbi:SH3 domain-containing protein [Pontibacter pudoricolor]|uniref:SH3 domain-containing protein n=1 Tax=Pontibacter pudoricolor TaxID=2694930 RepID=UPI001390E5BF|nr:SH3 domain-containing protein [Pontibacter pudoricolor]
MQKLANALIIAATIVCQACQPDGEAQNISEATIASEAGKPTPLPDDVLSVTKPLIGGILYSEPDFNSPTIAHFDTAQQVQLLDTTDALFVKVRLSKNAETYTGYISKAILPEQL